MLYVQYDCLGKSKISFILTIFETCHFSIIFNLILYSTISPSRIPHPPTLLHPLSHTLSYTHTLTYICTLSFTLSHTPTPSHPHSLTHFYTHSLTHTHTPPSCSHRLNLSNIFTSDPCPGQEKQLRINYRMLGFQGNLRIKCNNKTDCLVAPVELGFPPTNPPDI